MAACHKLGQGDRVRSLHELSKSANVGEGNFIIDLKFVKKNSFKIPLNCPQNKYNSIGILY
jgi:hypothetical protein